ncbi:MAG: hypothetical protein R2681_05635 [Pyrinomonadaceae bacterium]
MKTKNLFLFLGVLFLVSGSVFAVSDTKEVVRDAVSADKAESEAAIRILRSMEQEGIEALIASYQEEITRYKQTGERSEEWRRISNAIDGVSMQKDAYASGLYWFTDLDQAKIRAKKTNKPILSLRLLGDLNEEYSCANSRFFRSILYSNSKIAAFLKENYVLHWKSVRPAPRVTIDFGDGRQIVRTITGNSIHYILNPQGRIIDALPGLYSPDEFMTYLVRVSSLQNRFDPNIKDYQSNQLDWLLRKWNTDSRKIGLTPSSLPENAASVKTTASSATPTALEAAPRAVTKSVVELPLVKSISLERTEFDQISRFNNWEKLAGSFIKPKFDAESENFIKLKTNSSEQLSDEDFGKLISNLKKYVAIDTAQNEYAFHTKIYRWLLDSENSEVESFNDRVYDKLFLTPGSDKWLGLYSPDIYSAIENNGVIK